MNCFDREPLSHLHGEIVTVYVEIVAGDERILKVSRKIKTSAKTSAVNAWNMHRALCRGLKEEISWVRGWSFRATDVKTLQSLLRKLVLESYLDNVLTNTQHYGFKIDVRPVASEVGSDTLRLSDLDRLFPSNHLFNGLRIL